MEKQGPKPGRKNNNRKISAFNALMSSQFVYKLSCIDSPKEDQYKRYKTTVRQYLWDKKTPKIAYDTLITSTSHGGYKLTDLQKKDNALKIQWIKRLKKNNTISNFAYYFLPGSGELIWNCNLNVKHLSDIMPRKGFWYDVLKSWCIYNYEEKTDVDSIMETPLWYDSEILTKGKPIVSKKMHTE